MTGTELLEALSFVDERYIQEAETARLKESIPWMKILSVAACLCILITGVLALENLGLKGTMEEAAPEAAAPECAPEAAPEAAPPMQEAVPEAAPEESFSEFGAEPALYTIVYAKLRIVSEQDEDVYEAAVEKANDEFDIFETSMQVKVVIDPAMIPDGERIDAAFADEVTAGMLVEIHSGVYNSDNNTLYVGGLYAAE